MSFQFFSPSWYPPGVPDVSSFEYNECNLVNKANLVHNIS